MVGLTKKKDSELSMVLIMLLLAVNVWFWFFVNVFRLTSRWCWSVLVERVIKGGLSGLDIKHNC
jgi:type VI protein secretion system component VasK